MIEGFGESALLGVRVRPGYEAAATTYLQRATLGHRLAVNLALDTDPERRPLVTVTSENGELIDAAMIQQRLATPWRRQGPWLLWMRHTPPQSPDLNRHAPFRAAS